MVYESQRRISIGKLHERDTPLHHDEDLDMQLEDVSPEHGGNSLQLSTITHGNFLPFFTVVPYIIVQD